MNRFLIGALLLSAATAGHAAQGMTFEIYAASEKNFPGAVERVGPGSTAIYTAQNPAITLDDIASAEVKEDAFLAKPALVLRMTSSGARKLEALSREQLNSAVALVLDGKVISTPIVRTPLTDRFMLAPLVLDADTQRLVERINKRAKK